MPVLNHKVFRSVRSTQARCSPLSVVVGFVNGILNIYMNLFEFRTVELFFLCAFLIYHSLFSSLCFLFER